MNQPRASLSRQGDPLSRSQYHRLLRNPIYYGLIDFKGELYQGKHEPLISKALFDAVAIVVNEKSKSHNPKLKPYLYRGMCHCGECGRLVTIETQKGHNYLRCTKWKGGMFTQRCVREDVDGESRLAQAIGRVAVPVDVTDWLIAEFENEQQRDRRCQQASPRRHPKENHRGRRKARTSDEPVSRQSQNFDA